MKCKHTVIFANVVLQKYYVAFGVQSEKKQPKDCRHLSIYGKDPNYIFIHTYIIIHLMKYFLISLSVLIYISIV